MKLISPNINIKIKSCAHHVPEDYKYSNLDIIELNPSTKLLPGFAKKKLASSIDKKFGFSDRYMIRKPGTDGIVDELSGEDLSKECIKKAYKEELGDIDYFVMGTTTASRYTGSQATSVLSSIGQRSPAIQMMAGCSTSLASLYTGTMALSSGHDNVMILCTETMSKIVNKKIRDTWFGLGDGSACLWMEKTTEENADFVIHAMTFGTNGDHVDMYTTQGRFPPNQNDLDNGGYVLSGDGDRLYNLSIEHYSKMFDLFKESYNLSDINYLIPHQVNNSIITEMVNKYFDKDQIKVLKNNREIGNIGGASVLYTLSDSIEKKIFKKGDKILMMSVGGGLSYSMHLWEKL